MRVPAFIGGGFTAKALTAKGTSPFASNSLVHITDLHASILTLASVPFSSSSSSSFATAAFSASSTTLVLDGVSQWDFLMSGAELSVQGSAFKPRTEILHNMNSEAFGSGGALRIGDFKLVVEAKVSESEVYTYAQHVLQVWLVVNADSSSPFCEITRIDGWL
jgi:hypothetical protein